MSCPFQLAFAQRDIPPASELPMDRRVAAAIHHLKDTDIKLECGAMEAVRWERPPTCAG